MPQSVSGVRWPRGEATYEVGKPGLAGGNVEGVSVAILDEAALQIGAPSIQHLKLEIVLGNLLRRRMANGRGDHARIMRGDTVVKPTGQKHLHQANKVSIDIRFPRKRNALRSLVGALHQPNPAPIAQRIR